jgi:CDP-diacylglycerol--glycerol-3-phosphate 3-phosphatidyltransferase
LNREVFYVSNLISLSRFFLLAVTAYFLFNRSYLIAGVFIILIWISDLLDGYFARKRNEISELGKIIDPLADKTTIAVLTIILLLQDIIPLWFVLITIARDLVIFSGGVYLKYKSNRVLQSNWTGKLTVFFIGFTLVIFVAIAWTGSTFPAYHLEYLELLSKIFIFISIVLSFISLVVYLRVFLKTIGRS